MSEAYGVREDFSRRRPENKILPDLSPLVISSSPCLPAPSSYNRNRLRQWWAGRKRRRDGGQSGLCPSWWSQLVAACFASRESPSRTPVLCQATQSRGDLRL